MANPAVKPKRYPAVCPQCGKTIWVALSCAMLSGMNLGHGSCPFCKSFLHLKHIKQNGKRIIKAELWDTYMRRENDK